MGGIVRAIRLGGRRGRIYRQDDSGLWVTPTSACGYESELMVTFIDSGYGRVTEWSFS